MAAVQIRHITTYVRHTFTFHLRSRVTCLNGDISTFEHRLPSADVPIARTVRFAMGKRSHHWEMLACQPPTATSFTWRSLTCTSLAIAQLFTSDVHYDVSPLFPRMLISNCCQSSACPSNAPTRVASRFQESSFAFTFALR